MLGGKLTLTLIKILYFLVMNHSCVKIMYCIVDMVNQIMMGEKTSVLFKLSARSSSLTVHVGGFCVIKYVFYLW